MIIIDTQHFIDEKGTISPKSGPGLKLAEFVGAVIAANTLNKSASAEPSCFECNNTVVSMLTQEGKILWQCDHCNEQGVISNWHSTLWDMSSYTGHTT